MQGAAPRPGSEGSTRGVRAQLKVSKNSRTPQFNLIPLEPGPAGPRKLRMAATRAQGDSQPRSPPAVPPLCSHTTAPGGARCPALIYLGVGAFLTFPSPQLWGSWGRAGSRVWGRAGSRVQGSSSSILGAAQGPAAQRCRMRSRSTPRSEAPTSPHEVP